MDPVSMIYINKLADQVSELQERVSELSKIVNKSLDVIDTQNKTIASLQQRINAIEVSQRLR